MRPRRRGIVPTMPWNLTHASSGSTSWKTTVGTCRLTVIPVSWGKPKGPANWTATCAARDFHKRGRAASVVGAKRAAKRAAARATRK